jgi:hypothetical protein
MMMNAFIGRRVLSTITTRQNHRVRLNVTCSSSFNRFVQEQQHRYFARRITKQEIPKEQTEETQKQIEEQFKFIQDYELELSDELKAQARSNVVDVDNFDEMDEYDEEIQEATNELSKHEEVETQQNISNMKNFEDAWSLRASTKNRQGRPSLQEYVDLLNRDLAQDMIVMNLTKKCTFATYAIYVTGTSYRHMKMMATHVVQLVCIVVFSILDHLLMIDNS